MYRLIALSLLSLLFISCKETKDKGKVVFYTDFSFKQRKDSILVDSLPQIKQKAYCRIYYPDGQTFEQGLFQKNKTGKWQMYSLQNGKNILIEERVYSNDGDLRKYKAIDPNTGQTIEDRNYQYNNIVGIQKEFYPSGQLHMVYETDKDGNYINDFIVLSEDGEIIFKSSLGEDGSGYIKYYDKDNSLIWEGLFKHKKKEGLHYEYIIGYGGKVTGTVSTMYIEDKAVKVQKNKSKQ